MLFVSHNMAAVQALCGRIIHLKKGRLIGDGDVQEQINAYLGEIKKPTGAANEKVTLGKVIELRQLDFTPNPVTSGQDLKFAVELGSTQKTNLSELAVLIYSVFGARIAILDLRRPDGQMSIDPDHPYRISGTIKNLPLVEGDYRIGLFLNCAEYYGDYHDLASLTVSAAIREDSLPPYPAHYRGALELDYNVEF